jgi:hypothetical protein
MHIYRVDKASISGNHKMRSLSFRGGSFLEKIYSKLTFLSFIKFRKKFLGVDNVERYQWAKF